MKNEKVHKLRIMIFLFALIWVSAFGKENVAAANTNKTYALLVNSISANNVTKKDVAMVRKIFAANKMVQYGGAKKFKTFSYNTDKKGTSQKTFRKAIKKAYRGAKKNDMAIFFYTGHSLENYKRKSVGIALSRKKYYSYKEITRDLAKNIKCKKIICVINSCFAKSFITKGIKKLPKKDAARFIVFASSGEKQDSYGLEGLGSQYILDLYDGFTKTRKGNLDADYDVNGKITTDEIQRYVRECELEYRKWYADWPVQTPYCYRKKNQVIYEYSDIRLGYTACTIYAGSSGKIPIYRINIPVTQSIVVTSSNPSVLTITSDGMVSAWKAGTAVVTLKCAGYTSSCTVTVREAGHRIY